MECFEKIVNGFYLLNIFAKRSILDVLQSSKCTTTLYEKSTPPIKMKKIPVYIKGNASKGTEKHRLRNTFLQISWFE